MGKIVRHQPWNTVIWTVDLSDRCDLEAITQAMLTVPTGEELTEVVADGTAVLQALQEDVIRPILKQYMQEVYQVDLDKYPHYFQHFALSLTDGRGMEPHQHSFSTLSSVFYPISGEAPLIALDPRGSSSRGFPQAVRDHHFANFRHEPQAGQLVIFPAYLTHCVGGHDPELRLSLVTDLVVEEQCR